MWKSLLLAPLALILGACGGSSGGGEEAATTYSISGTLDAGATASSSAIPMKNFNIETFDFGLSAKTSCTDGKFYSVFCMSFETPPTAAEGDVDCSGGGSFTVAGLPLNQPIYCVVRRYETANATTGSSIGAIEIPAANLSGATDTIVGAGDLQMNVTIGSNGSITAAVTGNQATPDTTAVDNFFTGDNVNGVWSLTCDNDNGGTQFSAGACKCFLGEDSYGAAGYSNQDDCMNDSNGAGAAITGTVGMGIGMYVYNVTTNNEVQTDGSPIPAGTDLKAVSIWGTSGTPGSYVSSKAGGEGITNLGGDLTWGTTPADPTTAITWDSGNITVKDGAGANITINVPAIGTPNTMDHQEWVTWLQNVAAAAEAGGFDCTWGPGDSHANTNDLVLNQNLECVNQVIEALTEDSVGAVLPRVRLQPFCDQSGCRLSADNTNDSARPYFDANTFDMARVEFDDWHLDYPEAWASTDDYSQSGTDIGPSTDGIGVGPSNRFVFEPLQIHPSGAGFRQAHHDERHYECVSAGASGDQVTDSACPNDGNYYELACWYTEELAIKFLGTSSPLDVIFESTQSPVAARLVQHGGGGANEISPNDSNVIDMCASAVGSGGDFTFFATGTKQ